MNNSILVVLLRRGLDSDLCVAGWSGVASLSISHATVASDGSSPAGLRGFLKNAQKLVPISGIVIPLLGVFRSRYASMNANEELLILLSRKARNRSTHPNNAADYFDR